MNVKVQDFNPALIALHQSCVEANHVRFDKITIRVAFCFSCFAKENANFLCQDVTQVMKGNTKPGKAWQAAMEV